ncbi:Ig-like domain-containing protein [Flavobacterium phycosphaerae]|uniref:Ig-like domain-containing protein n=1 Tax=Flavobacterium phycosphaerae TaxID=2697515 RepID=UPI001389DA7D|nr:autotransporter-associated beta strand repeat-containing protein [Flavobacterium phycosphaerae]
MKTFLLNQLKPKTAFLTIILFLVFNSAFSATYYSKATGNPSTLSTWGQNTDGTGTAPTNFTTSGDIFILRSASTLTTTANWTIGSGVTLQMDGSLAINGNGNAVTINGTVIFTNASATQVSMAGAGSGNDFIVSAGAIVKTVNANGLQGTNCSLPANAAKRTVTLSTTADYEFNGTSTNQLTLGLPATVNDLTINNASGVRLSAAVTVSGMLSMTSGTLDMINTNLTAGSLTGSGNLTHSSGTAGTRTLTIGTDNTSPAAYTGVISNGTATAVVLTKSGTGKLTLTGTNTYTGATSVTGGVLNIQNAQGTGTTAGGVTVSSGAAIELQGGITVGAEALSINNTGVSAGGSLRNISGNNTWGGTVTLVTNAARINSDSGTLTLSAGNAVTATNINLTLGGVGNIDVSGTITTGSGTLTKDGSGTATLSGTNTYTGATTISVGVLNIQNNQGTGTTAGGVTVASGAALQVQGGITVGAEALTLNGSGISSDGALRSVGTGNLTNTWGGTITLASTPVRINADSSSTLSMGAITGTNTSLFLGGLGNIVVTGAITTGTGSMTDDGPGSVTFSGSNTYTGATTIAAGITSLGASNVFANSSSLVLNGGTFKTGTATGFSDTMGTITLSANSTFALGGTAHTMTFSDSHLVSWTGTTLTVNGWTGTGGASGTAGKIVIGTTSAGLTTGQLAKFNFTGYAPGAVQLSNGEVVPTPAPAITSATTASSTYGAGTTYTITGSYTPTSYNATGLPTGMSVNTSTGVITVASTTAAGTYSISIFATNASGTGSTTLTYTVNPAALNITADNASKCFGTTYTLGTSAFTPSGLQNSETVGSVTLTSSGASSGAAVGTYAIVPSAATGGTFTAANYTITYTDGTLTVIALPSAPSGTNGSVCVTGTASLSASVGGGETVDWYDASTGGTLLLSNSTSYTTPSISSTTIYYAEARNTTTGCVSGSRTAVTATVNPASVGGSVTGGTTICSGSASGLLTLSGNTGTVVRWEYAVSPFSSWTTIANTSTTYTSGTLTQTTKFRAVVQSGVCSEANSADTTVTVDPTSVGGTVASAQSICYGTEPADLTLSGNTGTVVKWQSSSDAGFSSPTDIAETSTTLNGTTIGALTANTYFRAVVQSGVCSSANSAAVLITVDATTVGGTVSSDQTICSGTQPADLTLSGHVGSVIQWESSTDAGFSSPTAIIVTSATLTGATIGSLTQDTYFRAVVQSGACDPVESDAVLITVNDASVGGSVTGGTAICAGSTSGLLTLAGHTGTILRWEYAVSPFSSWTTIANTVDTYTSGALTQTTRFRAVVQSGVCSEAASAYTSVDINTTTWSSGAWDNGAPDNTTAAIISSAFVSGGTDLEACSLTINNSSTVIISSGDTVRLSGALTAVSGSLVTFNNNANLIQTGSTNTNSGAIIIKRNSSALMRQDYTLWSSPVASQQLQAYSPQTLSNRFYTYNTTTNLYDVVASPSTTNFATAQGYLIRMPNNHPASPTIWVGQFAGVPNNGDYSYTLVNGGAGQRFNLVGNPYPSPIDATAFVGDTNNSSSITGTLYFWRKTNNALSPSYCTWTLGGFVSNGEAQVYDPNDVIQTGQGFFVEGTGSGTVNFDNTMRIDDHADQFFKVANTIERNRIWLNATNAAGLFSQTMVGYITNATQGVDATIDGKYINDGGIALTSLIGTTPFAIQGRALPFDAADVVPMNFKVAAAGEYTIAIDHVDGLFAGNQTVYLRDNTTGFIHDLTTGGYTFSSEAGNFDTRFDVLYQLPLGYTNPVFNANQVVIYKNPANEFVVNSGNAVMASVKVFDIRGRLLVEQKGINASQITINAGLSNEVLLVQVTSEDGVMVTKKVIK